METRFFTKQDLHNFISSEQFDSLDHIPISKHRAISQINNPRASHDDIILIAIFDKNVLLGYLGVLPDFVYDANECHKVGWLTCFWINWIFITFQKSFRALKMFFSVLRAWEFIIMAIGSAMLIRSIF